MPRPLPSAPVSMAPGITPGPAPPAIEVVELEKRFGRSVALQPTSFTVARGECVAVLGQNGSGKSTLVRLLSTLLLPDGGSALVFGYDVVEKPRAVRRLVNRVSVEASFFKKLSAVENLSYASRFYGMRAGQTRPLIPEILDALGFPPKRRREPMEHLSRGMQQKVALARALLTSPVLLLADEPTTGLDPRSKLDVQQLVVEMRATHDATVLLCTHDLAEAEALADRVGILHQGRLIALEPADELKARYGGGSLEEAFFAATGTSIEEGEPGEEVEP